MLSAVPATQRFPLDFPLGLQVTLLLSDRELLQTLRVLSPELSRVPGTWPGVRRL